MKLVLSRKGFDSQYGGFPSPIFPDGRILSLPIPSQHDRWTMGDVRWGDIDPNHVLRDLTRGRFDSTTRVHLDPDLDRRMDRRLPGWRPSLGQTGSPQGHLSRQGVGAGDVFLFFGWFQHVKFNRGRWSYDHGSPGFHMMFGWLEVEFVLPLNGDRSNVISERPWLADHPHVAAPSHYTDPRNTIYGGREHSGLVTACAGGGVFNRFGEKLVLTKPGASRSIWRLPPWWYPQPGKRPLSFHASPERWALDNGDCRLRTVGKGQEFVADDDSYPELKDWVSGIVSAHAGR
ncbi:MAG: hypothetical protein ABFC67_03145 [Mizugakiibacter sp.]|uniref:Nmad3 family putative nucleotide modification protein n=1 Tax=Mizugakiibacter sp. TaxID=1972610 RepID=UPI0031BEEDC6|nr:hypothetical protein [Xanthomonadaceae bacterium]